MDACGAHNDMKYPGIPRKREVRMMEKKRIAVLFGGQSTEHEVSCMSVMTIIDHIDREQYDILLIGITKEGKWLATESAEAIRTGRWREGTVRAVLSPDATQKGVLLLTDDRTELVPVDVVFPVLHGARGEDGTIQGLLEMAKIPYVGCGVLSSAVSMDKWYTKLIVDTLGIRQARYVAVEKEELADEEGIANVIARVEQTFPYPVFVKPSRSGSSRGVSKASDTKQLRAALLLAAEHDRKMLVEEMIVGHEIECAVLGGDEVKASGVGEIFSGAEFYDYEAKYSNPDSQTVTDPELPAGAAEKVRDAAVRIFKAVDGYGLARVDFFVTKDGQVIFNEINTMPGFTSISMYPMLWEKRGLSKFQLVDRLIQLAYKRQ